MEKNILRTLTVVTYITILACCKNARTDGILQEISKDVWSDKNHKIARDSVLHVSLYKKTNTYLNYAVGLAKRPLEVSKELETCYEEIDERSIFSNKCQRESEDYKNLVRKGLMTYSKRSRNIDDSHSGYMYIFRNNATKEFKKIERIRYFQVLEHISDVFRRPTFDEEQKIFDSTSNFFWSNKNPNF